MANKPYDKPKAAPSSVNSLQRGKACLRCRKRKMKCDGMKPACQQCTRAKKGDGCEYDDGKGKTRTQLLKETIAKLESRVQELECPNPLATPVVLFQPAMQTAHSRNPSYSGSGSPCSFDSPDNAFLAAFSESSASPPMPWDTFQSVSPNLPMLPDLFLDERHSPFTPSDDVALILLDIFALHSRQTGIEIDVDALKSSLRRPLSDQKHTALMNAIYLWACFVARPEPLSQHEDYYLTKALEALPDALRSGHCVDAIRTSCILATYFLANGRALEGSYHASAATALAEQIGLGRQAECTESKGKYALSAESISTFWQVYNLDKTWSVVLRKRSNIADGPDARTAITCPWPQDALECQMPYAYQHPPTVQAFLAGSISATGFSSAALRAKASTLLAEADRIASQWYTGTKVSPQLVDAINNLERIIALFLSTLVAPAELDAVMGQDKINAIVTHTLAQAAIIHLHRPFVNENPVSTGKCAQAARACTSLVRYLNDGDYVFLDPIVGPCWSWVADNTIERLDALEQWPLSDSTELINELSVLCYAMTKLDNHFPVVASGLSRVQRRLA